MKFEGTYKVGIREIGRNNKITNIGMLGLLEDLACKHSDIVGFGVNNIEKNHKVWILMDWKLEIIDRPTYGDELKIKTWARTFEKPRYFTYRDFEVLDHNNRRIALATSKWILYDIKDNKITKLDNEILSLYKPESEAIFGCEEIEKIQIDSNIIPEETLIYNVKRRDIDVNKHMHNLYYLTLCYEALPEDVFNNKIFSNVRIMYKHQIILGDTVKCFYRENNNCSIVEIKSNDEKTVHAIIELS